MAVDAHTGAVRLALLALALVAVLATPASAQDPRVIVDPDSPTAHEYSIPLERVRRQADPSGESRAQPPSARVAPLFGEGIVAQASGAGSGSDSGSGRREGRERSDADRRRSTGDQQNDSTDVPEAVIAAAQQPGPPAGGVGSTLLVAGVAAFVLVAGGLGGLLLRRRSSGSDV